MTETRLYIVDVNDFWTWVSNPERIEPTILEFQHAVPNFIWPLDSHPGQWVQGKHIVRWWFEEK